MGIGLKRECRKRGYASTSGITHRIGRGRAFTLVELMVVIFVITVLICLTVPTLGHIRRIAYKTRCQNNLKQYGVGLHNFMADFDGLVPGFSASGQGYLHESENDIKLKIGDDIERVYNLRGLDVTQDVVSGGSSGSGYDDFIQNYVSPSTEADSVNVCPTVDINAFDRNSSEFKGFYTDETFGDQFDTPYCYSLNGNLAGRHKGDMRGEVIAVIERNILLSWGETLSPGSVGTYAMERANIKNSYMLNLRNPTISQGRSKSDIQIKTDVGFDHWYATNTACANYVAMDGHVGSVASNKITVEMFDPAEQF